MRRRTLLSPKAWKSSFSEFHRNYSPKSGSFRSPEKPRHSTLPRDRSSVAASSHSSILESPDPESLDLETVDLESGASTSELPGPSVETASGTAEDESKQVEEGKDGESEDKGGDDDSESSSEMDKESDSDSLGLSAADDGPLHIEESDNSQGDHSNAKENGLENGAVSGFMDPSVSAKVCKWKRQRQRKTLKNICVFWGDLTPLPCSLPEIQDAPVDKAASEDTKTTTV